MYVPEEARRGLDGYTTSKKVPLLTVFKEIVHGGWGDTCYLKEIFQIIYI